MFLPKSRYLFLSRIVSSQLHMTASIPFHVLQTFRNKGKSSHDLLNDAKLSSVPAVDDLDDELPTCSDEHHSREMDYQVIKSGICFQSFVSFGC